MSPASVYRTRGVDVRSLAGRDCEIYRRRARRLTVSREIFIAARCICELHHTEMPLMYYMLVHLASTHYTAVLSSRPS